MSGYVSEGTETPKIQGYGNRLVGWLERSGYENNDYLKSLFKSGVSDETKYLFAMAFYDSISGRGGGHSDDSNEIVHLVPYETSNGSFYYVNRRKGWAEAIVETMPNGQFDFSGLTKYITRLGGRGEISGIADRMADGRFFNKN